MRYVLLALGFCLAAPLDAQYRSGALAVDGNCKLVNNSSVRTSNGAQYTFWGNEFGAWGLGATSGVSVTWSGSDNPADRFTASTSPAYSSVRVTLSTSTSSCRVRVETIDTDELIAWASSTAADAERERRKWGRVRNLLLLGGVAVLGATAYNFNNEVERDGEADAITLVAGTTLGFTIGFLAFNQAQPEVDDYRRRRDRYRTIERQIREAVR